MSQKTKFILLLAIFVLPTIASFVAFYFFPPPPATSYGQLISPAIPLPEVPIATLGRDKPALPASLRGKWLILMRDEGACDARCRAKLIVLRQSRLVLGREQDRVLRVALLDDNVTPALEIQQEYEGTVWVAAKELAWLKLLPVPSGGDARTYIYAIDPLGNVFIRYGNTPDIKQLANDLRRVLKASQIG
jgi:hypothetical protein